MELKNFVDFGYSLVNMDEVKSGSFPLPKEITFQLKKNDLSNIHRKIKDEKNDLNYDDLNSDFEIDIFGILFKFESDKNE